MGKLGKKARKFAKKNLQSVMKRKRKINSMIKRKASKREERDNKEDEGIDKIDHSTERLKRNFEDQNILDTPLEDIIGKEASDEDEDGSDSDGYLSEEGDTCAEGDVNGTNGQDKESVTTYSSQKNDIYGELVKEKKKLEKIKKKDPEFCRFLDTHKKSLHQLRDDEAYSDDEISNDSMEVVEEDSARTGKTKVLTTSAVDAWCEEVTEKQSLTALTSLLNAYHAAAHYGTESNHFSHSASLYEISNGECFTRILLFMLRESNKIFRGKLGISCSSCKKETVLDMRNTQKWKTLNPLIKSYLRSTLFLLGQATDSEVLGFALTRLRDAIIFFAAFPPLLHRLLKVSVHLWATGKGSLSAQSFLIIRDIASTFGSDWFGTCLIKMYKTYIAHCKFMEPGLLKHMEHLRNFTVELCSLDIHRSSGKALVSIKHLAKILQLALKTKKKEALKKVCSWQYTNCVDLWVTFISEKISDYDLQPQLFIIIQLINGVACLFPGPRYLPLRIKCIQWLNTLSRSSRAFIPVASYALDILEYKVGKTVGKRGKDFNFASSVKLPKYWLKSQNFREQCVFSSIELLCMHFDQWSHHISFPELATVPLIRLKKFCETTAAESCKRAVKRFIDQMEQNIDFVRKKRDEVAFSPKDEQEVEAFLQLDKSSGYSSFRQYYRSVMQKGISQSLLINGNLSSTRGKKTPGKKRKLPNHKDVDVTDGEREIVENAKIKKKRKT